MKISSILFMAAIMVATAVNADAQSADSVYQKKSSMCFAVDMMIDSIYYGVEGSLYAAFDPSVGWGLELGSWKELKDYLERPGPSDTSIHKWRHIYDLSISRQHCLRNIFDLMDVLSNLYILAEYSGADCGNLIVRQEHKISDALENNLNTMRSLGLELEVLYSSDGSSLSTLLAKAEKEDWSSIYRLIGVIIYNE